MLKNNKLSSPTRGKKYKGEIKHTQGGRESPTKEAKYLAPFLAN